MEYITCRLEGLGLVGNTGKSCMYTRFRVQGYNEYIM